MDPKIEKIKGEIKTVLEQTSKDVSNDYIVQTLMDRIDSIYKLDKLYLERLTELVEEQRLNKNSKDDIKTMEVSMAS